MMAKISNKSLEELREMAKELGLDPNGLRKAQLVEAVETKANSVIGSDALKSDAPTDPNIVSDSSGILSSDITSNKPGPEKDPSVGKVAVFSERELYWAGVGRVTLGYNFVTKEAAEKWVTHRAVREATPEEVANHFGVN
jgi:hypothetical protein